MNCSRLFGLLAVCQIGLWVGCGDDRSTVIQPEAYELTAQEVANQKEFETLRGTQDEPVQPSKQRGMSR